MFRRIFEFVQCTSSSHISEFWISTIAPNKGFVILFATAPHLMIGKRCSGAYLTLDLES